MYIGVGYVKKIKIVWKILKLTDSDKLLTGFILFFFLSSLCFMFIEPNINNFSDGIWYSFSVVSTIGFGDIKVITSLGRFLSILLSIYAVFIVALIPGIVVSLYSETLKLKVKKSRLLFLDQLENLPNLSHDELVEISKKIKQIKD